MKFRESPIPDLPVFPETFHRHPPLSTNDEPSARGCILGAFSALFGRPAASSGEAPSARAAVTSFELRVTFTGMCLFVPDKAGKKQMYVLLPKMKKEHRHKAVLQIDVAHFGADHTEPAGFAVSADLKNTTFALPDAATEAATLKLCPQVVNLFPVTKTPIDPTHSGTRSRAVCAVLLGDGAMKAVAPGLCWEWDSASVFRPIAHQVEWRMTVNAPDFTLVLRDLPTGRVPVPPKLPTLHPIKPASGTPYIQLSVFHVPPADLPPDADMSKIKPGEKPPHFLGFYDLYPPESSVATRSPILRDESGSCTIDGACPKIEEGDRGGSPYTCMVASVDPTPP